jgi:hypothetical protein
VDLVWYSEEAWQQGLIYGGTIIYDKKKQEFTFGTLFCGLELLGTAWDSGTHIFSIEKLNQIKKTRPKAEPIYQMMGEAPWGGTLGTYLEILVGHCCSDPAPPKPL